MAKGYWIAHVTVSDPDGYGEYIRLVTPVVERFDGRYIARGGRCETPESAQKDRHVIVEFPDYDAAVACYHSDDYKIAAKIRLAHSDSDFMIVEGV